MVEAALPVAVVLPGIAATLALVKAREVSLPMIVGSVIGLGYSVLVLWATLLILLRMFNPVPFFAGLAVIAVALGVLAYRRQAPSALIAAWREEIRADRWTLAIGGGAIGAFAIAAVRSVSPALNFGVVNPFRYWADGVEVAAAGRVPETTLQWGTLHDPAVSKLGFSGFAGAIDHMTNDPLSGMSIAVVIGVIGLAFAGWSLGRALGLRYAAPLVAILSGSTIFFLKKSLIIKMTNFSADGFAALAAVTGAAFAIQGIRTRNGTCAIPAGIAFAAAAVTHLVPTVIALALVCAYAALDLLLRRDPRPVAAVAGSALGAVIVAFALVAIGSGGAVGFDSVEGRATMDTRGGTFDPTWYLISGDPGPTPDRAPETRIEENDGWYNPPEDVLSSFLGDPGTGTLVSVLILLGVGAIAVGLTFVAPESLKAIPSAAYLVWIGILAAGFFFNMFYDTYVPAVFPQRRLFSFIAFPLILIALVVLELVLTKLEQKSIRNALIATATITAVALVVTFPRPVFKPKVKNARHAVAMFNWINKNVPCDARLFATQRTAGIFQSLTGRHAVSEGMAPYLRPQMLNEVVELLLDGRSFLEEPPLNSDFLSDNDIDYLVLSKDGGLLDRIPPLLGLADEGSLQVFEGLELVKDVPRFAVYEVTQPDPERTAPVASDVAGYECRTEPLTL